MIDHLLTYVSLLHIPTIFPSFKNMKHEEQEKISTISLFYPF